MGTASKRSRRVDSEDGSGSEDSSDPESSQMGFNSDGDGNGSGSEEESNGGSEMEEEDGEGDEGQIHGGRDAEMEELEKEYLNLRNAEQDLLKNLRRHKDEDALKGQAVKNQKALWDKTLEFRFILQKAFSTSNKLPKESVRSSFCNSDEAVSKAYLDLIQSSKQTLSCMLELQEALLEKNPSVVQGTNGESKEYNGEHDFPHELKGQDDEEWFCIDRMQRRIAPYRNSAVDKWQRKTQVTTGAAALKGKLHAFNQNISDQVAGYMRDPTRMIKRMQLRRSSVGIFGEVPAESNSTKEEGNVDGDPELLDDSEFYQQLLKEFFESCDLAASETAFYALKKLQPKKRKVVDRRASKSRKIRYHVHEKIVNFMAPVPMDLPPMAPKLFENLFGSRNQRSTTIL
ncbi:uncharacterized protein [Typha angustifolia]|uniref:uncharacterized protein isoform X1 n=2 Tax=Typha angustifolia TaxID=59011 RepID=UPI003C2FEB9A